LNTTVGPLANPGKPAKSPLKQITYIIKEDIRLKAKSKTNHAKIMYTDMKEYKSNTKIL